MYAIDSNYSRKTIEELSEDVDKHCPERCVKFIVGNKCDLVNERQVTWEDGSQTAESCGIEHQFEASALQGQRDTVVAVFNELITQLVKTDPNPKKRMSLQRLSRNLDS